MTHGDPGRRQGAAGLALALAVFLLLPITEAVGQEGPSATFNSMRTPSSPAFVLLGVEPSSVERPNTPSDFAATVLSATSNLSSLPRDFALEVSPYWLVSHRSRSWRDDVTRTIPESIQRTLTLSLATAELGTADAPIRGVAGSARMSLFSGRVPATSVQQIDDIETRLASSATADLSSLDPIFNAILSELLDAAPTMADSQKALQRLDELKAEAIARMTASGEIGADTEALRKDAEALATTREGFLLDLAGGAAWQAPNASLATANLHRWGVWLSASYTLPNLSFVGLARYLGVDGAVNDAFDFGARFIYTGDRYALSTEYVDRHVEGGGDQWRLAGVIDYRISPTLWITGTFGRGYDDEAPGSLLAQLGLSLNLSRDRYAFGQPGASP